MRVLITLAALLLAGSAQAEPLSFAAALALAESTAPSLQAKALQVSASRTAARSAGALPDPKLALGVDNYPVSGPTAGRFGQDEMTMARIGIAQDVPNGARRDAQVAAARADIDMAEAQIAIERRKIRQSTALAWIDLVYAERRLAALDGITSGLEGLWKAQPATLASGATRPGEALGPARLRAEFEDTRSELVANAARARAELTRWTGEPTPSTVGAVPAFEVDPTTLRAALDRHPTLAAYDSATRRAEVDIDAARAAKRPDWGWEASYGRRDPMFGDMVSAGVTISLPLFSGNRQDPLIAARILDANRVRIEREDARRTLAAALETALADHTMHHEQWMRAKAVLVPTAEQRADLEVASYAAGRAAFADVSEALTALAGAKLQALEREALVMRDGALIVLSYGSDDQ